MNVPAYFRAPFFATLLFWLTVFGAFSGSARAATPIDPQIDLLVWKLIYGVSDAKIADPTWLAKDDDADSVSNGDELAAGTDPFNAASKFLLTSVTMDATLVTLKFPTVLNKMYVVQSTTTLNDSASWKPLNPPVESKGNGTELTLSAPKLGDIAFYRVVVQGLDTDQDGASDWAEVIAGSDPTNAHSGGASLTDHDTLLKQLQNENVVTIVATKPLATPPASGATATDNGVFTVSRGGALRFTTITIPLTISGSAISGTDYIPISASVVIPKGVISVTLPLVPKLNINRTTSVTATVQVNVGGGFTVGSNTSASVLIAPPGTTRGTGLTGNYYQYVGDYRKYSSAYEVAPYVINPQAKPTLQRIDPTIDFIWGKDKYTSGSPGPGINGDYYWVRWSGQIQPEFSETYYFETRSSEGMKLRINGQLVIDDWLEQGYQAPTKTGSIALQGGQLYTIEIDYFQKTQWNEAHLSWYSQSRTRQIVPKERLYPATQKPAAPEIISENSAVGFVAQPFSFTVVTHNQGVVPATFALDPRSARLPAGLTLNAATGEISGKPTAAGETQVTLIATNVAGSGSSVLNFEILQKDGGVTRELWTGGVQGDDIAGIPVNSPPSNKDADPKSGTSKMILSIDDNNQYGKQTGERLRGYITAPATGNYYFWLAANNQAELWISNNSDPVNKVRRATVAKAPAKAVGKYVWNAQPLNQQSPWIALEAGQSYYFEVLHNTGSGTETDHLSVGWFMDPTGSTPNPIANGSGLVPSYVLSVYDYPPSATSSGTFYVTNMSPQGTAQSNGIGSADLRLNAQKTSAILHFNYAGLSSPRTAYHIHADPDKLIIFDIDEVDKFNPELRTADGGYIWNIVPVGSYTVDAIVKLIESGGTYINIHTVLNPAGEIRGNFGRVIGSQNPPLSPPAGPTFADAPADDYTAARFLNQATFGSTLADIASVKSLKFSGWIDRQFQIAPEHLTDEMDRLLDPVTYVGQQAYRKDQAWWKVSINATGQLRQRMAFALSEILVVGSGTDLPVGGVAYYDTLLDNAFGNFRDLLKAVTLSPTMGDYLNMRGNDRGDIATGRHANENYAREIMQLFSIGLNRLWPDGTVVLDSQGRLISTYDQRVIEGMAKVFTGWNYSQAAQANGRAPTSFSAGTNYRQPMTLVPSHHDLGDKRLLDNVILPAASIMDSTLPAFDNNGLVDLDRAIDALANHPNVGPYICRQLIQRFVTSNPSPAYLQRVVQKFNNDGTGVRGNLKSVLKAILLDGEARDSQVAMSPTYGKQREPILRMVAQTRAFKVSALTGTYSQNKPDEVTITTSKPHQLSAGNATPLDFNPGGTLLQGVSTAPTTGDYYVRTVVSPTVFTTGVSNVETLSYDQPANSRTLTVHASGKGSNSKIAYTSKVYLQFVNGVASGIYTLSSVPTAPNDFTITTSDTPKTARSGTVYRFSLGSEFNVYGVGSATGTYLTVSTHGSNHLRVNDHVWMNFSILSGVSRGAYGEYIVTSVQDNIHFTCSPVGVNPLLTNGRVGYGGTVFPLVPLITGVNGPVAIGRSNYNVGDTTAALLQAPLASPTVFNYFYPDYRYPGALADADLTTPEFQLTTDTSVTTLSNTFTTALLSPGMSNGLTFFRSANTGYIYMDVSPFAQTNDLTTASGITALVKKLSDTLGTVLSPQSTKVIADFLADRGYFPTTGNNPVTPGNRVREIVHLIINSPEYAIQK